VSWLTDFVRPRLRSLVRKAETPDNLWLQCANCGQMIFHRELRERKHVCPHCDHHMRLDAADRLAMLFDHGIYETIELPEAPVDPLRFRDRRRYTDRLKDAQAALRTKDAMRVAHGVIGDQPAVAALLDFAFMGGSMGIAVGEAFLAAARLAVVQRAALIAVTASGGARMQEGILSLMQMPRTTIAVSEVKEAGLPYIVLLTDPTTGGVSASFAMLGDVAIAEPGAAIGFAGQRVIQQTIRETLPENFQRAEYLHDHGIIDMVVHRRDLHDTLGRLLAMLMQPKPAPAEPVEPVSMLPGLEDPEPPGAHGADAPDRQRIEG